MRLKLIACEIFMREASLCIGQSAHTIDPEFVEIDAHLKSDLLRTVLQQKIDAVDAGQRSYDAILLLYGLCGTSTVGLSSSRFPLVIPRAHDCCTILLGSKARFTEYFGDSPSTPFSSPGYIERSSSYSHKVETGGLSQDFAELVAQYGEESARYLIESMNPHGLTKGNNQVVFIEMPQIGERGFAQKCREQALAEGKEYVHLNGDIKLIRDLIDGNWGTDDFLVVKPMQSIVAVYDWDEVMRAEAKEEKKSD